MLVVKIAEINFQKLEIVLVVIAWIHEVATVMAGLVAAIVFGGEAPLCSPSTFVRGECRGHMGWGGS